MVLNVTGKTLGGSSRATFFLAAFVNVGESNV